jgi:hypothetical protein
MPQTHRGACQTLATFKMVTGTEHSLTLLSLVKHSACACLVLGFRVSKATSACSWRRGVVGVEHSTRDEPVHSAAGSSLHRADDAWFFGIQEGRLIPSEHNGHSRITL